MSDLRRRVSAPDDPKGRLISIFVGAVLLPSLALSYVAVQFVHNLAQDRQVSGIKKAERSLYWIEGDLNRAAHARALEAARAVGQEKLLDGRMDGIRAALVEAGYPADMFDLLRLDVSQPRITDKRFKRNRRDLDLREVVMSGSGSEAEGEDSVPWTDEQGKLIGWLCFKFSPAYVRSTLLPRFFDKDFDPTMVIRVAAASGDVFYETPATRSKPFEVNRPLGSASLQGLTMSMRYRDLSIQQDVQRWKTGTLLLIGFIDLMLGAGLFLVYSNVRREMHLSRLKSDFVANVSHELKTPLALIRLFAETLEMGRVPNEGKARQYYLVINKESQRLSQLIDNILDFSRIEAGKKEYRFAPTDVARVVGDVLEAYRFQIEQQGFTLEVAIEEDLPEVQADKQALGQALLNLVNNAIKYSPEDKYLRLQVRRDGQRLLVSVSDRGIGVARSEHKKIFEKFYRAEDSLVHETKGSGLGLPLVRHIMEAHGGWVEVESAPGRGSTFTLVLPITAKAAAAVPEADAARPETTASSLSRGTDAPPHPVRPT